MLLFMILLSCFYGYGIGHIYGFVIYPDEFGYWAHAARLVGYDWSDVVSLGSYYSFGYSIILFPFFYLFQDSVMAYRAAVTLNFFMLLVDMICLYKIAVKCLENQQEKSEKLKELIAIFSTVAIFSAGNLFYAWMTMTEIPLLTVYILICMLMLDYLKHSKFSTLICLVLALVYIFFVHMRAVGVLIAGTCIILLHVIVNLKKKRQVLLILFAGTVIFIVGILVKNGIYRKIYADASRTLLDANNLFGQVGKLRHILTWQGFLDLLSSLVGKLLYLGVASYGTFYWGMYALIKNIYKGIQNAFRTKHIETYLLFDMFVVLSVISQIMITAIYMIHPQRLDNLTYGRYNEFILPLVMIAGMKELSEDKQKWTGTGAIVLSQLLATLLVIYTAERKGLITLHGYFMVGMSYLYDENNFEVRSFFLMAYAFGMVLTVLVTVIAHYVKRYEFRFFMWTVIIALQIVLAIRIDVLYKNPFSKATYRDTCMADKLEQYRKMVIFHEDTGLDYRRIVYIEDEGFPLVDILQFIMRDEDIVVYHQKEYEYELLETDLVLLNFESSQIENMKDRYRYWDEYGHFILFYN